MSLFQRFLNLFRRKGPKYVKPTGLMRSRTDHAISYAQRVTGLKLPCPVEWLWMRGEYVRDGIWYHSGAGARCQFLPKTTRIVVYCGPHGEQSQEVYNHEAGHAVLRVHGHPAKYRAVFMNWVDV
jgi:hypothetical protein